MSAPDRREMLDRVGRKLSIRRNARCSGWRVPASTGQESGPTTVIFR